MNIILRLVGSLALITVVAVTGVFVAFPVPCAQPIEYRIGIFDERFGITEAQFRAAVEQAEQPWEDAAGKQLFVYDPEGSFTVNLLFDERQQTTIEKQTVEETLSHASDQHDELKSAYNEAYAAFKEQEAAFTANIAAYEADITALNAAIAAFNTSDTRTPETFQELRSQQEALRQQVAQLETQRLALNEMAQQVNALAAQESDLVSTYNTAVESYNEEFADGRQFDQGEYIGNAINIYEFGDSHDLYLVLVHELGHALHIGHVDDPAAVMYYLMNEQNESVTQLSAADRAELANVCSQTPFDVFIDRLNGIQNDYTD